MTTHPQGSVVARLEHDVPLARLTTVGIGGPARAFARPETVDDLEQLLAWAQEARLPLVVVGLGSNVLASDSGIDALVVRLAGELASVEIDDTRLVAGGGAPNAVALHRARAAGLGGMEFACAIPGTAGGGVRMNAGAYERDWSDIVERTLVVAADGAAWLSRDELDLQYRHSAVGSGQVVAQVEFRLHRRDPAEIRRHVAELNTRRKATQPINRRTFGSVFKNPDHELGAGPMLDTCGLKGYAVGGARISPRHANFIENVDGATAVDAVALMAEARRRALEQYGVELEREVELLGSLDLPPAGERPITGGLPPDELEGLKERGWRQVAAIDEALARGEIGEDDWHRAMADLIVPAYLAGDNPRAQSGHSGDAVRWEGARRLLLDAVDGEAAVSSWGLTVVGRTERPHPDTDELVRRACWIDGQAR